MENQIETIEIENTGLEEILSLEIETDEKPEMLPYEKMSISNNALDSRAFMCLTNSTDREIILVVGEKEYTISSRGRNGYNPKAYLSHVRTSVHPLEQTGLMIFITPVKSSKTKGRCLDIIPFSYTLKDSEWRQHEFFQSWEKSSYNNFRLSDRNADILNEVESIIVGQILSLHPELDNSWYYGCQGGHALRVSKYPDELWTGETVWKRETK